MPFLSHLPVASAFFNCPLLLPTRVHFLPPIPLMPLVSMYLGGAPASCSLCGSLSFLQSQKKCRKGKRFLLLYKSYCLIMFSRGQMGTGSVNITCLGPEVVISPSLTFCSLNLKPVKCCVLIKLPATCGQGREPG